MAISAKALKQLMKLTELSSKNVVPMKESQVWHEFPDYMAHRYKMMQQQAKKEGLDLPEDVSAEDLGLGYLIQGIDPKDYMIDFARKLAEPETPYGNYEKEIYKQILDHFNEMRLMGKTIR